MGKARLGPVVWFIMSTLGIVPWAQAGGDEAPRNIILVGWDGAQREHVKECLARGELPALKALAAEGTMVDVDIRGTTDTKAGWSQILTGYDPDVTGVYSNGKYQPVPPGMSVFERLEEHFGAEKVVTVAVIGKKGHCGEIDGPKKERITDEEAEEEAKPAKAEKKRPDSDDNQEKAKPKPKKEKRQKEPGSYVIEENGVKYRVTPGKPYMNMHKACDVWTFGLLLDEKVGTTAIEMLEKYKDRPFFFFVHFAEVDHKGHGHGENSKEYNDALISNDRWTGKIIEKLKELGLYDKTLVYVTSDHGFNEGATGHGKAPYVFLATNDAKVTRNGDRADITPTIMDRFGLNLKDLRRACVTTTRPAEKDPPLAGHSLIRPLPEQKKR